MTVALINVFIDNSIHVCNALWSHPPLTYLLLIPSRLSPHQVPTSHSSLFMSFLLCDSRGLPRASCVDIPYPAIHWSLSNSPMSTPGHNDFLSPFRSSQGCPYGAHRSLFTELTITIGLTGIFSCEVPGGGSFHSGNLITSL